MGLCLPRLEGERMKLKEMRGNKFPDDYLVRFFFKNGLDKKEKGEVIEFGCGNGSNLRLFKDFDWSILGVDKTQKTCDDFRHNFSDASNAYFWMADLNNDFPKTAWEFDVLLFPSSLYYLPQKKMEEVLTESRKIANPGALFFIRMRDFDDYRYKKGKDVSPNGTKLDISETGEEGETIYFYTVFELLSILEKTLRISSDCVVLKANFENIQNNRVIDNSDTIIWGRLANESEAR